jgi:hypothetical protein
MHRNGFDGMHIAKQQANSVTGSCESIREESPRRGDSAQPEGARHHDPDLPNTKPTPQRSIVGGFFSPPAEEWQERSG